MSQHTSENGLYAPPSEMAALKVLKTLTEASAPSITRASNGSVSSVAAAYTLLGRLEKRGLVARREEHVLVGDMPVRRVLYRAIDGVLPTQATEKIHAEKSPSKRERNYKPTGQEIDSAANEISLS